MRLGELLDADVAVLGPKLVDWARAGLGWWVEELQGMAPGLRRPPSTGGGRLVAERRGAGQYVLVRRDGRSRLHTPGRAPIRAALRLPDEAVLIRRVDAPPVPVRDLRRMMALDVDRLTPFRAEEVYLDVAVAASEGPSAGARAVLVGVTPRLGADAAVAEARAAGLELSGLVAAGPQGQVLDFLPAMRASGALGRTRGRAALGWTVVALLTALNVGCWIWRDSRDLADLRAAVAAQQPQVQRVIALRASLLAEARRRRALSVDLAADAPLRALDAVSRALPDGAWVQRATLAPRSIRIAGFHKPGVDVVAALRREPLFTNVQSASSEVATTDGGAAGDDPFDLSADLAGPR